MDEIAYTKAEILSLHPGDVVLLTVPQKLRQEQQHEIAVRFQERSGCEKVIVLTEGMKAQVLRKQDIEIPCP